MDAAAPSPLSGPRRAHAVFAGVLLLFTAYVYVSGAGLDPTARDQVHDLSLALRIRDGTALSDGNRHPLLPALLAPVMSRQPSAFTHARWVSVGLTALVLLGFYLAVARVFSAPLALLAALAWLFELRFQARRICPEPLLSGLLVLAVAALARAPPAGRRWPHVLPAGLLLGAAWCAKGSALLSVAAALVWLLASRGRARILDAAVLLAGFVLAASPLLAWNVAQHGDPLYNVNSAHVQWEDAWDFDLDRRSTATPASYLASHDAGDVVSRLASGFVRQRGVEWVYGFLALALVAALFGAVFARRRTAPRPSEGIANWRGLAIANGLIWLPAFAWYAPIVSSRRLLFPIFAILIPPALDLLGGALRGLRAPGRLASRIAPLAVRAAPFVAGAMLLGAVGLVVAQGNPSAERHVPDEHLRVVAELGKPEYEGARILAKPSRTLPPDWLLARPASLVSIPASVRDEDVGSWLTQNVDYVLLNPGLSAHRPALAERFSPLVPVWRDGAYVLFRTR